tara:strand:+ start:4020 stop:4367 length:348 start_codon:yes stop_codon:yes gene_type:complete
MKAKISRIQIDIDYKCPNCYLHFRLSNNKIPQKNSIELECPECSENLTIPPFLKTSHKNTKLKSNNSNENKVKKRAIQALRSQGYGLSEATNLVNKTYKFKMDVVQLIKKAIINE